MTLEELKVRLEDHIIQCDKDKVVMTKRIDGAYARMWIFAGSLIGLLTIGFFATIALLIQHMLNTHDKVPLP